MDFFDIYDISEKCRLCSQDSFNGNSTIFNSLIILSFTIRFLNRNGRKLTPYIAGLIRKPDIIVLSETRFKDKIIDKFPGYIAFSFIRTKETGGGLSFFCANDLIYKAFEVSISNTKVFEHFRIQLHSPNKKTINIVSIYRASFHGVRARFLSENERNNKLIFQ